MAKKPSGGEVSEGEMAGRARELGPPSNPAVNSSHGPFGDIRPPIRGPVSDIPPAPLKLGYQLFDENTGKWVAYPDVPPPARLFGYFQYQGYWIHYDPLGIGPGGARPGEYLFQGFYAGYAYPPEGIPPYGWDPPPRKKPATAKGS